MLADGRLTKNHLGDQICTVPTGLVLPLSFRNLNL